MNKSFSTVSTEGSDHPQPVKSLGIWPVRAEALAMAEKLQRKLGGDIIKPWEGNEQSQRLMFRDSFRTRTHWILIMAAGIAVRFIDGLLDHKTSDPAVVVIDEGGHNAISFLSGHQGGANALAFNVANALGANPIVSTATEATKSLIAGIGCRKGVTAVQIDECMTLALSGREFDQIRLVATIDLKSCEPGLLDFCEWKNLPLQIFAQEDVAARAWSTKPSEWVMQNIGTSGVCEPCALMVSPRGKLIVPKTTLNGVAVALVEDSVRL